MEHVSVVLDGSLGELASIQCSGSLAALVSIGKIGSLDALVSIRVIGSLASHVSIRRFGSLRFRASIQRNGSLQYCVFFKPYCSLYPDVSVAHDGSLKGYVSVPRSGPLMVRVSVTSQGLINAKLRQQRSPSIDILVAGAAQVLDQGQAVEDFRLGSLDRFAPAAVNFLLGGAHGLACHWRHVALAAVAIAASQHRQLRGVFSQPCRQFEQT